MFYIFKRSRSLSNVEKIKYGFFSFKKPVDPLRTQKNQGFGLQTDPLWCQNKRTESLHLTWWPLSQLSRSQNEVSPARKRSLAYKSFYSFQNLDCANGQRMVSTEMVHSSCLCLQHHNVIDLIVNTQRLFSLFFLLCKLCCKLCGVQIKCIVLY